METTPINLVGKLLLAMPSMSDPRFEKSVIYICAHSREGAMGLIVNKPAARLKFSDLMDQLDIEIADAAPDIHVHFGGPVENGRGFVLHTTDYMVNDSTLAVDGTFGMTATLDILEDIALGQGPNTALLALGYSGWTAGQLDAEILQNGWLICDATADLVFHLDDDAKWAAALDSMGISPLMLSADAGRA
ncbi:MAG: YqgE/AlgH family protein [Planktomarina sp.]